MTTLPEERDRQHRREDGPMEEVAATIRDWVDLGRRAAFGRVVDVQGFGGSSQAELMAVDE